MVNLTEVAELKCALEEYGALCVMMGGMILMLQWSASSWDFPQKVQYLSVDEVILERKPTNNVHCK